jgi:hypothetical protein
MALGNNKKSIKNNNGVALDYFFFAKKTFFFVKLKNSSLSFYIEKEACNYSRDATRMEKKPKV